MGECVVHFVIVPRITLIVRARTCQIPIFRLNITVLKSFPFERIMLKKKKNKTTKKKTTLKQKYRHTINAILAIGGVRGYRRRKWTRWHEFKSCTRLIAFHIALIPLGKVWIQLFTFQLWVHSRTDWVLQPWWGNESRRRKTLNWNLLNSA